MRSLTFRFFQKRLDTSDYVSIHLPSVNTYQQTQQLDAMGDATRRAILARLLEGPMPVGKLAAEFPVSRPAISQHLRILKQARLVVDRAEGTRRLYQLNPEGFESLREYFEQFWTQALIAFKEKVEEQPTKKEEKQPTKKVPPKEMQ
jgi:DNA-binding transcriptional ArsR family regulator